MRLADKIATMARRGAPLPYLRRVAYLESHGTEYIDTGYVPNGSTKFEIKAIAPYTDNSKLFGFRKSTTELRSIVLMSGGGLYYLDYGNGGQTSSKVVISADVHLFSLDRNKAYIDGALTNTYSQQTFVCEGSAYLFACNQNGSVNGLAMAKVYHLKIFDQDQMIIHLIPVLDLSGRPCFYDEVSGQFFYNQGTGEFTWGELDADSALVSSRGGGAKCLTPRRSYRRLARHSARFCAHSQEWEVAA